MYPTELQLSRPNCPLNMVFERTMQHLFKYKLIPLSVDQQGELQMHYCSPLALVMHTVRLVLSVSYIYFIVTRYLNVSLSLEDAVTLAILLSINLFNTAFRSFATKTLQANAGWLNIADYGPGNSNWKSILLMLALIILFNSGVAVFNLEVLLDTEMNKARYYLLIGTLLVHMAENFLTLGLNYTLQGRKFMSCSPRSRVGPTC